ncbi:MAG TPA: glycoside hydrolase, partial [Methanoregulaceae archaeon]|nr:glycoside hydrolase [Methanoregulaceae archaeon]HOH81403.1 glycoside hydrolase [Methanoregulaceae archaeon]
MGKKICIHGHFYQPPRENPWTGMVEKEPSAAPWQNWNERITDECYLPNSAARILDGNGRIRAVSNNYARISGDFGPTLLAWMERFHPGVYDSIISADSQAQDRFSGHGSAIAHPYHHVILPLLPLEDKETEIRWGIRDFEDRFGRYPEGMWLPEMAVD